MSRLLQRIRVPLGFVYGFLFLYLAEPRPGLFFPGIAMAATGLALRLWASGYLDKGRELAIDGPYAWTRNPLYLGSFIMGLGFTLAAATTWLLVLFPLLFLAIYVPVMRREELELLTAFGPSYSEYRYRVPLFVPGFSPSPRPATGRTTRRKRNFQWEKVIYNREYKAMIGFLLITFIVWSKMLWF